MAPRMWQGIILVSTIITALSIPMHSRGTSAENLVGTSTKVIATALLQDSEENTSNLVFSPFGYSTILAILGEGAKSETEQQINDVLKLSKETTRNTFKEILTSLKEKYKLNVPQFRTWFYVYKNFSVEENYKQLLLENYLTDVKNVYPHAFDDYGTHTSESTQELKPNQETSLVAIEDSQGNSPYKEKLMIAQAEKEYLKDIQFSLKESSETIEGLPSDEPISQENSKYPDNKPAVNIQDFKIEDDRTKISDKNAQIDITKPSDTLSSKKKQKHENLKQDLRLDLTKILPGAKHKGRESTEKKESLIIFNGLYFEGKWETPFHCENSTKDFLVNENDTVQVQMMTTKGLFKMGELPHLDSTALSVPYQGGRYSLVIILPKKCNGLNQLIASINGTTLQDIMNTLQETEVEVELPKFKMESTTKPESALSKIGVKSVFEKDADLTGIAKETGLYAEEVVQLVTLLVDEGTGTTNFMTATSVTSRGIKEKFYAKHPFLFFIEDDIYKVTMVAGKIFNPTVTLL